MELNSADESLPHPVNPSHDVVGRMSTSKPVVSLVPWRFWLLSIGFYTGLFLSFMDITIVASSLHAIAIEFEVFTSVNWMALAYTLAECSCGVVFCRMSDIIGRQKTLIIANVLFLAFSLGCGFSRNLHQLVAFRALQGVGGAGLYSMTMVILPEVCPDHLLEYGAVLAAAIIVGACVAGPLVGGLLTQYVSWRWIFWINGPICAIAITVLVLFWPKADKIISLSRRLRKSFDLPGALLLIAAAVLVVFAFQNVGVSTSRIWGTAVFIVPLVLGLLCWLTLFTWEYFIEFRTSGRIVPVIPLSLFRNRFYAAAVLSTLFVGFNMFLIIFALPLREQLVGGKSTIIAAVMLLPMLGASIAGCALSAIVNIYKNFLFECTVLGSVLQLVGFSLLATMIESDSNGKLLGYSTLIGIGGGFSITGATVLVAIEVPPRDYAPAQGLLSQARVLGGSLGLSTLSVLLHNELTAHITGPIPLSLFSLLGAPQADLPDYLRIIMQNTCIKAFQNGMKASAAVSGVAILITLIGFRSDHMNTRQQRLDMVRKHTEATSEVVQMST